MIASKKGQIMFNSVSPIYEKNEIMKAIFEAIGTETDMSTELGDEILRQIFPQTADSWGLRIWEQRLGLVTNISESIERRRIKIITKLQTKFVITPEKMAFIIKNYTGIEPLIEENVALYTFDVYLKTKSTFSDILSDVSGVIKKIKPSHLAYNIIFQYVTNIIICPTFKRWLSNAVPLCGTIDCSYNSYISTKGRTNKNTILEETVKGISDKFSNASENTIIIGNGKRLVENLELDINEFISDEILKASEDFYLTGTTGKRLNENLEVVIDNFISDEILKVSENLYLNGTIGKSLENIISNKINSLFSDESLVTNGTDYKQLATTIVYKLKEFYSDELLTTTGTDSNKLEEIINTHFNKLFSQILEKASENNYTRGGE